MGESTEEILSLLDEGTDEGTDEQSEEEDGNSESSEESEGEEGSEESESDEETESEETPTEEDKLDLEKEESDDLTGTYNSFNKKKFLTKYPTVFKEFPALEKGFYANRAYREVFPTLNDAKEAQTKIEQFDSYLTSLDEGKSSSLLKAVKERNPESFSKVVNNYLGELKAVDDEAYYHIITNIVSDGIIGFFEAGKNANNEEVMEAAKMFKAWMFGEKPIEPSKPFQPKSPEKSAVDEERKNWEAEKFSSAQTEVQDKLDSVFTATIKANIDPKDQLTPFSKKAAIKEANDLLTKALKADTQFQSVLKKMWDKAKETKFSAESRQRIRAAYDSKAKTVLPGILRKVRTEALSGASRKTETSRTQLLPRSGSKTSSPSTGNLKKVESQGNVRKSTFDILNED